MDKIVNILIEQIKTYGLPAVFVGSIVEEAVAPIPSPAVMMGAGFILLEKHQALTGSFVIDLMSIALIGALGALLGSYLVYSLAYFGGRPVIEKTKRFTGLSWTAIEKFESKLQNSKSDEVTIALLRSIPVMPAVVISGSCGLLRINPLSYSISFYIGGVVRNIIFLIIGWQIGDAYQSLAHGFDDVQNVVTVLIAAGMLGGLGYLYWRRGKMEKVEGNSDTSK